MASGASARQTHFVAASMAAGVMFSFLPFDARAQRVPSPPPDPRPLAPLPGGVARTLRPTFRVIAAERSPATLDVCADRGCARVLVTLPESFEEDRTVPTDLPPGVVFWRLRYRAGETARTSATWPLRVTRAPAAGRTPAAAVRDDDYPSYFFHVASTRDAPAMGGIGSRTAGLSATVVEAFAPLAMTRRPAAATMYPAPSLAVGDFDASGWLDVALSDYDESDASPGPALRVSRSGETELMIPIRPAPAVHPALGIAGNAFVTSGDADGDGYDDVAVTAGHIDAASPAAMLVLLHRGGPNGLSATPSARIQAPRPSPPSSAPPLGEDPSRAFAMSLAFSDVDGDGRDDLVVASPAMVRVYRGTAGGVAAPAAWEIAPPAGATFERATVHAAGDTNGDGYGDFAVAARSTGGPFGRVLVYLGSRTGPRVTEPVALSAGEVPIGFGNAVASAGDIDGDGFGELLVSFTGGRTRREAGVYLYRGSDRGPDGSDGGDVVVSGRATDRTGASLAGGRDGDGDGYADFLVGAPGSNRGRGSVLVYRGRARGGPTRSHVVRGTRDNDGAGYAFGVALGW